MCGHRGHHHRHHVRYADAPDERMPRIKADDKRASDAERETVVAELRAHASEGRLTVDELDQRMGGGAAAVTRNDRAGVPDDLPRARRRRGDLDRLNRVAFGHHLRSYLMVMALLVAIWALTGAGYFWPVWPALGWGIGVVSHASAVRKPRGRRAFG